MSLMDPEVDVMDCEEPQDQPDASLVCPTCSTGSLVLLGALGAAQWARCRQCGATVLV